MQEPFGEMGLTTILTHTRDRGYLFVPGALDATACARLEGEIARLALVFGDHVAHPINPGTPQEVRQWHERAYYPIDHPEVPVGTSLCHGLAKHVASCLPAFPELAGWLPTEIGYQRYRAPNDWISPHRDRRSDQLLSVTYTVKGSAWVKVYVSEVEPPDYRRLTQIDEHLTLPGTAMFLRAPGFGSGVQVIHEVLPPLQGERLILNLRMRKSILPAP